MEGGKKVRAIKLGGVLLAVLLLVTGCGSEETLSCSSKDESSGLSMEQIMDVTFKDDKINKVKLTFNTKATNELYQDAWDELVDSLDEQFNESNSDGVSLTKENDEDNYTYRIELSVDLDKASADALDEYDLSDIAEDDSTLEELRDDLEAAGYTCK